MSFLPSNFLSQQQIIQWKSAKIFQAAFMYNFLCFINSKRKIRSRTKKMKRDLNYFIHMKIDVLKKLCIIQGGAIEV